MPKLEQPNEKLKAGVAILPNEVRTLQIRAPTMEILIGRLYRGLDGEMHTYEHGALRVIAAKQERVHDFGRYGATIGEFGAEGSSPALVTAVVAAIFDALLTTLALLRPIAS